MVATRKDVTDLEAPTTTSVTNMRDAHEEAHEVSEGEKERSISPIDEQTKKEQVTKSPMSKKSLQILTLLAVQNCGKNILMRFIMKEQPQFLHSTAVVVVELIKLILAILYIQLYEIPIALNTIKTEGETSIDSNALISIYHFIRDDWSNTVQLTVPAACYILQMSLEYVAFANIDASTFSVLVQTKMLAAALFFWIVLKKKLCKRQLISLLILTSGVMLCSIKTENNGSAFSEHELIGILATFGIAISSGFASVYTEKVIKSTRRKQIKKSLAHVQAQLAVVSLLILGFYTAYKDTAIIIEKGFFYKFNGAAFLSCLNSSIGGLIVAVVLKYADSVLKGYATACSVVLTGIISKILFGTSLSLFYGIGMVNVVCAVILYNGVGLEEYVC